MQLTVVILVSVLDNWLQVKLERFPPVCPVLWFLLKKRGGSWEGFRGIRGGAMPDR